MSRRPSAPRALFASAWLLVAGIQCSGSESSNPQGGGDAGDAGNTAGGSTGAGDGGAAGANQNAVAGDAGNGDQGGDASGGSDASAGSNTGGTPGGDGGQPGAGGSESGGSENGGNGGDGGGSTCATAAAEGSSVGCEFYATSMDDLDDSEGDCFAVFIANASDAPAHLTVTRDGSDFEVDTIARLPSGTGTSITYAAFDAEAGLAAGSALVLFLAGSETADFVCPVPPAVENANVAGTGIGHSFRITSDVPVSAFQMRSYGIGGNSAGSLLLPTNTWGQQYMAVSAAPFDIALPSFNIVAAEDATEITITPVADIAGGNGLPAGLADTAYTFTLDQGEQAQFSQQADLSGSTVQASKPIGVMAGQECMRAPTGESFCDHAEQMLPPLSALGHEYVAVSYRPRVPIDDALWSLRGTVDGTTLTFSPAVSGAPSALDAGDGVTFSSGDPFIVQSQDAAHPLMLFTMMTGGATISPPFYGDPDFVASLSPQQFLSEYHFFAPPTVPENNLVFVRAKLDGSFADVTLDCAGVLSGWQAIGDYEWTRLDLTSHDFEDIGDCSSGYRHAHSPAPFGLWVWGWGSPETTEATPNSSYGYPAGMRVPLDE